MHRNKGSEPATSEESLRLSWFPRVAGTLTLRVIHVDDVEHMHRLLSSPGVYEGLLTIPQVPERAFSQHRLEAILAAMDEGRGMQLIGEEAGNVIGTIGLRINWKHRQGGLGYHVDESFRRKGHASAMMRVILEYGFEVLGLHRIQAETWIDNEPSKRLLSRHGFSLEGIRRQAYWKAQHVLDSEMWSLLSVDPRPWDQACKDDGAV